MIDLIIRMLQMDEHLGQSELIDIAKGKYKLQTSIKAKSKQRKRVKAWQLKEQ